jgi:hypothetical protein
MHRAVASSCQIYCQALTYLICLLFVIACAFLLQDRIEAGATLLAQRRWQEEGAAKEEQRRAERKLIEAKTPHAARQRKRGKWDRRIAHSQVAHYNHCTAQTCNCNRLANS